jgi:hypothetical protein
VLGLTARLPMKDGQSSCRQLSHFPSNIFLHHRQRQIDTSRTPGRRPDRAVDDKDAIFLYLQHWETCLKITGKCPMSTTALFLVRTSRRPLVTKDNIERFPGESRGPSLGGTSIG